MPAVSQAQQRFFGAECGRAKKGQATRTKMSKEKVCEYARVKRKGLPARKAKRAKARAEALR